MYPNSVFREAVRLLGREELDVYTSKVNGNTLETKIQRQSKTVCAVLSAACRICGRV
jgi:hypothetical protein